MKTNTTQVAESLEAYRQKTDEMASVSRIVTGIQRWIDTGNREYLRNIIVEAAWLYTGDSATAEGTATTLDRLRDLGKETK